MRGTGRFTRESTPSRMRSALETVLLRDDGQTVVEECRRCGTTHDWDGPRCPTCGSAEIARYQIG